MLQQPIKDVDVVTNASPEQVELLFSHTIPVGKQFGIIIVMVDTIQVEVATYRSDDAYVDGRRPTGIQQANQVEDASVEILP